MSWSTTEIKNHIEWVKSLGENYRSISSIKNELLWNGIYVTTNQIKIAMKDYPVTKDGCYVL